MDQFLIKMLEQTATRQREVISVWLTHIGWHWSHSRDAEHSSEDMPASIHVTSTWWPWQRACCYGRQHACCWTNTGQLWWLAAEHGYGETCEGSKPDHEHTLRHSYISTPSTKLHYVQNHPRLVQTNTDFVFNEHTLIIIIIIIIIMIRQFIRRRNMSMRSLQGRSTPGSRDECRTAPDGRRPLDQADRLEPLARL